MLGYPEAALADADHALKDAREIGQAATLDVCASTYSFTRIFCGNYARANALIDELVALADEKGALFWKAFGMMNQGCAIGPDRQSLGRSPNDYLRDRPHSGQREQQSGCRCICHIWREPMRNSANSMMRWRCIGEAMTAVETTKERWCEAEVNRIAGEIALKSPEPDAAKAEAYFERALAVARQQQAKSWELRASMSLARLWRDQGKVQQARELLAPVYGWFTEGFDTRDLKEAKALLEELAA